MYVKMVQGETHSSDSDVASEFYFSDVALYFDFFPHTPPPFFTYLGEGHNNCLIYILHCIHIPSRYSNIELDDVTSEPWEIE